MTFHCTICYDSLVVENDVPAGLSCGHTYHKSCIYQWMATKTSPQCPLCKKKVTKSKIISPLYFSTNDEVYAVPTTDSEATTEHAVRITQLRHEKSQLVGAMDSLNKEASESREEINRLKSELLRVQTQRRYIKIIKKVAELDDDLSDEHIQRYLASIQGLPPKDLLVHVGALRARQLKAAKEAEDTTKRYEMKVKENEHLKQKIARLNQHMRKGEPSASSPSFPLSFNSNQINIIPRQQKNVIVLDDSDDEDNKNANNEDEAGFLVEEHVTDTLNPRKRRNDFFDTEESSKRLRNIVAIDLSQDDGEESQAGSSSRYSA